MIILCYSKPISYNIEIVINYLCKINVIFEENFNFLDY